MNLILQKRNEFIESISPELYSKSVKESKLWAFGNGFLKSAKNPDHNTKDESGSDCFIQSLPFSLFPSPFPKDLFNLALRAQDIMNELYAKVSQDPPFLEEALGHTIQTDSFTAKLWDIHEKTLSCGVPQQEVHLGFLRSDYLLHQTEESGMLDIKQVEVNCIAASFAGMSQKVCALHDHLMKNVNAEIPPNENKAKFFFTEFLKSNLHDLPVMNPNEELAKALLLCANHVYTTTNTNPCAILFVVEEVNLNIFDQMCVIWQVKEKNPNQVVLMKSFEQLQEKLLISANNALFVDEYEIAVVYYRTGYSPSQYSSENDWELRLKIEKSLAIKCPSVQLQLAGSKKVQQMLTQRETLLRFISPSQLDVILPLFVEMFSLDSENSKNIIAMGIKNPENFVLKPQREGGGYNYFDCALKNKLSEKNFFEEASSYILMQRIKTLSFPNFVIPSNQNVAFPNSSFSSSLISELVSELGIFGVFISSKKSLSLSRTCGSLLRSKLSSSAEGGIVAGFGCLDSPYLY